MILEVKDLNFSYDEKILEDISFAINKSQVIGLLGANGAGKSTLFRLLLKLLTPDSGEIFVQDKDLKKYNPKDLAKEISYIPQSHNALYNYTVLDVVSLGFAGQMNIFQSPSMEQKDKAFDLLKHFSIEDLANRGYMDISGGQRQLALIARALVQDSGIILMDEPVANLDFGNQALILQTIKDISEEGYTILVSMHNPIHAYRYTDSVLVLDDKKILEFGPTSQVLTEEVLEKIYGVDISLYELNHRDKEVKIPLVN